MSNVRRLVGYLSVLLPMLAGLAACDSGSNAPPIVSPPPPPPAQTSFNQFVQDQFVVTADDTDPLAVDDEDFSFDENPASFDNLLQ